MKLEFGKIEERKDLLPKTVYDYIKNHGYEDQIKVAEIDLAFADGESLSREYGVPYGKRANMNAKVRNPLLNCLVVEGIRGEESKFAALVVPYGKRANMNAKVRNPLDAKKMSFADLNRVCEECQMEYGSITPIGLPEHYMILVDEEVMKQEEIIVGGGLANSKLLVPSKLFGKRVKDISKTKRKGIAAAIPFHIENCLGFLSIAQELVELVGAKA